MTQAEVAEQIERYVRIQFRVASVDTRFSRSLPLFDAGYIDSVGVVELLTFLSEEFAVNLPDDVLLSDQFSTIDGIAAIICTYATGGLIEHEVIQSTVLPSRISPRVRSATG